MNTVFSPSEAIRAVFAQPGRDLVGMVDDLLAVCSEHDLELDWSADCCLVRACSEDWREVTDLPLRKSSFRGLLARLAALCNEGQPDPRSPYGGKGEIAVGSAVFEVVFTNTPAEQRLRLRRDTQALPRISGDTLTVPLTREGERVSVRDGNPDAASIAPAPLSSDGNRSGN